jgi:hypothetical protein
MSKSSVNPSLNNIDLGEDWSSHPAIEWLSANKKILLWGFLALLACLILAYRLVAMRTLNAEADFFQAQTLFTQFQQAAISSPDSVSSELDQLKAIMERHPELKPKYEGPLAQTLLMMGQDAQAQAFATDIFERTAPDDLSLYQDYSQVSLLISEEHYADALQQTQLLQAALDQLNEKANPILYVFNLIRLAMLYQQMGQTQEELQTWEQLQNQPQRLEAVLAANHVLKVGQASLNQYIEERKNALTSD